MWRHSLLLGVVTACAMLSVCNSAVGQVISTTGAQSSSCPAVTNCTNDTMCSTCLLALTLHASEFNIGEFRNQAIETSFFRNLTGPQCFINNTVLPLAQSAIVEMNTMGCPPFGSILRQYQCIFAEFNCSLDPACRQCLDNVHSAVSNYKTVLNTSTCRAVDTDLLSPLSQHCNAFPSCSYSKVQCELDENCSRCWSMLREGDMTGAIALCSTVASSTLLYDVVSLCTFNTETGCSFIKEKCTQDQQCNNCLAAVNETQTSERMAIAFSDSPFCQPMANASTPDSYQVGLELLSHARFVCGPLMFNECQDVTLSCLLKPTCAPCLAGTPSEQSDASCALEASYLSMACQPCPSSVFENNRIVLATSIVGGLSVLPCLFVVIAIIAYKNDVAFTRSRIIIGLMISNIVYSIGSAIPVAMLRTDMSTCGQFKLSFATIRFGRAWWFAGKFLIIFFELLIIGISAWALKYGLPKLSWRREALLYTACVLAGMGVFIGFEVKSHEISDQGYNGATQREMQSNSYSNIDPNDDRNDDSPSIVANDRFTSSRSEYDTLVQQMLLVWCGLLGLAILLWIYLRWTFMKLTRMWSLSLANAEKQWDRDYWTPEEQGIRHTKRRMLNIVKEGYDELAHPLEPFVVVFIIFGIPACVMATDFCQNNSQAHGESQLFRSNQISVGQCDVLCELVLAFRSLATVAVYFYSREHRIEVFHVRVMWRRLRDRVMGCFLPVTDQHNSGRVRFRGVLLEEVQMIPWDDESNNVGENIDHGSSADIGSSVRYQLMVTEDGKG